MLGPAYRARSRFPVNTMKGKSLIVAAAIYSSYSAIVGAFRKVAEAESVDGRSSSSWWDTLTSVFKANDSLSELPFDVKGPLTAHEYSKEVNKGIIQRFETNDIYANEPIEDRHTECYLPLTSTFFFGTFDGHSGWHCSETLKHRMPHYVGLALASHFKRLPSHSVDTTVANVVQTLNRCDIHLPQINLPPDFAKKQDKLKSGAKYLCSRIPASGFESTEDALSFSYTELDRDICQEAVPLGGRADESFLVGVAGSCAISAVMQDNSLFVSSTGDCRAVIGRCDTKGQYSAVPMSVDQTADNGAELKRLQTEHPGEERTVVMFRRLLGQLQPLRAFGDVCYKWSRQLHEAVLDAAYGRPVVPRHVYRSPPYLTATPVVTMKELDEQDKFLIIATDGLWDTVSNDKAVQIIADHCQQLASNNDKNSVNGATKLIRYGLSKDNNNTLSKVFRIPNSFKREVHDDITVTVVYFKHDMSSKL